MGWGLAILKMDKIVQFNLDPMVDKLAKKVDKTVLVKVMVQMDPIKILEEMDQDKIMVQIQMKSVAQLVGQTIQPMCTLATPSGPLPLLPSNLNQHLFRGIGCC